MSELGKKTLDGVDKINLEEYENKPSSAISQCERFIENIRKEESYERKVKLLQVVNNIIVISDSVSESVVSGLLSVVDDCIRNTRREQSMIITDYKRWNSRSDKQSLKDDLEEYYAPDISIIQASEMNKYIVENNDGDILCELFIGSNSAYISDYYYIDSFIMSNEDKKLATMALRSLVNCCSNGFIPSLRIIDWSLFFVTEFPNSQMSRLSCSLIEQMAIEDAEKIVNCQSRVFNSLISSHRKGNKRAFKSVYKITNEIHPDLKNEDRIVSHLKDNIVDQLHGGDRKMCRLAISELTGENRLKLYYNEITGKM